MTQDEAAAVELLRSIDEQLRVLVALSVQSELGDLNQRERIERLSDLGLSNASIASILGVATTTVAPTVSRYRRRKAP